MGALLQSVAGLAPSSCLERVRRQDTDVMNCVFGVGGRGFLFSFNARKSMIN